MKQNKSKRSNNKGFSLVELIVVMAIMAILVGAVAPQVIKYVEKARESKDLQVVNTVYTAVQTAISSSEETVPVISSMSLDDVLSTYSTTNASATCFIGDTIKDILGTSLDSVADVRAKCKSDKGSASTSALYISYSNTTGAITVSIAKTTAPGTALIGPVTN